MINQEPAPPSYCDCIGTYVLMPWHHDEACARYRPTPRGTGSTPEGRATALAQARAAIEQARKRHQETHP